MEITENKMAILKMEYAKTGLPQKIHIIGSSFEKIEDDDGMEHQVHYYLYEEIKSPQQMEADCIETYYDICH